MASIPSCQDNYFSTVFSRKAAEVEGYFQEVCWHAMAAIAASMPTVWIYYGRKTTKLKYSQYDT